MILECTNTCDRHDPKGKGEARATFYEKITWQLGYSSKISVPDHHEMTAQTKETLWDARHLRREPSNNGKNVRCLIGPYADRAMRRVKPSALE